MLTPALSIGIEDYSGRWLTVLSRAPGRSEVGARWWLGPRYRPSGAGAAT